MVIAHEIISIAGSKLPLIQEGHFQLTGESTCTKFWLTAQFLACPGTVLTASDVTFYKTDWAVKPQIKQKLCRVVGLTHSEGKMLYEP